MDRPIKYAYQVEVDGITVMIDIDKHPEELTDDEVAALYDRARCGVMEYREKQQEGAPVVGTQHEIEDTASPGLTKTLTVLRFVLAGLTIAIQVATIVKLMERMEHLNREV